MKRIDWFETKKEEEEEEVGGFEEGEREEGENEEGEKEEGEEEEGELVSLLCVGFKVGEKEEKVGDSVVGF